MYKLDISKIEHELGWFIDEKSNCYEVYGRLGDPVLIIKKSLNSGVILEILHALKFSNIKLLNIVEEEAQ